MTYVGKWMGQRREEIETCFFKSVVLDGNLTTMVLKFRRRRLKNIHGLRWKVDGVEKGRDKDMSF